MPIIKSIEEFFHSKIQNSNTTSVTNFDVSGNKLEYQNGGFFERWTYDEENNMTSYENPAYFETFEYIKKSSKIFYSNSQGKKWKKILDVNKNEILYEETKNLAWKIRFLESYINLGKKFGLKWIKEYNSENLEVYYKDNLNNEFWKFYDFKNNLIKKTNKKDDFESYSYDYDENGNIVAYKDSKGKEYQRKYDSYSNLLFHQENGETTQNTYRNNLLIQTEHPNGRINKYEYNENGLVIQRLDSDGYKEITSYDENNNIIRIDNDVCTRNFEINYW